MKEGGVNYGDVSEMNYSEMSEYISKKYLPHIKSAELTFMFTDTSFSYNLKSENNDLRNDLLSYYRENSDYTENSLDENTLYKLNDWDLVRKEIDPETEEVYDTIELTEETADNTYNFGYLGAIDLNWKLFYDEDYDKYFYVIHPHLGGDIRGNYGEAFILEGDDKEDLFYRFYNTFISGMANAYITFDNGDNVVFDSEQDSDVFRFNFYEEGSEVKNALTKSYVKDFESFDDIKADEFLELTIELFNNENVIEKKALGGGVDNDETPKAYVQILGYSEGKWITLTDFENGEAVLEYINNWMSELNAKDGGNREEYEIHDYEGFGRNLYSEYMGESEFDDILESYNDFLDSDFPYSIVEEYMKQNGISEFSEAISEMNDKYHGAYDDFNDFAEQMVEEGIYVPSARDMYVSDTDKRIIAGEESDSRVSDMDAMEVLQVAGKVDEYNAEKDELEEKINDFEDKKSILEDNLKDAEGDYYESILFEIGHFEDEIEELQDKLNAIDDNYREMYEEEATEVIYDEIYEELDKNLDDFLDRYGYSDDLSNVHFLQIDYDNIANELSHDYTIISDGDKQYVFRDYEGGGKVVRLGKPNRKYTYFVIEMGSKKIVSGWENKEDALDHKKELSKNNRKMKFGVYTKAKAISNFALDLDTFNDWVDLTKMDKVAKVKIKSSKTSSGNSEIADIEKQIESLRKEIVSESEHGKVMDIFSEIKSLNKNKQKLIAKNYKETGKVYSIGGAIRTGSRKAYDKSKEVATDIHKGWLDADFGDGKGKARLFKKGGVSTKPSDEFDNKNMLLNQTKEVAHHSKELNKVVKKQDKVASWVVAKMERATTDLSDVTHYLDGNTFAGGGDTKYNSRVNKSPLLEYSNFEDGSHINLLRLIKPYKSGESFAISDSNMVKGQTTMIFKTLEEAKRRYDLLVKIKSKTIPLLSSGTMDKNFKEGGEVSYIAYKNQEIMFEPIYNEYYVNDEQFETLEDAKRYIDKGTPMGSEMKDAYGKGFFEQGGDTIEGDKEQNEKCIKVFSDFVNEIVNVKYTFTDKKNKTLVFVLNEEPKMDTIEDINSFLDETYDNCKGIFADSTIKYDIKEQTKTLSLPLLNNNYGDGMNLFVDGGVTEDKHLVAKAIEFIVGYPIEKDSLVFEPTKVNFKYKGKNVSSSLSRKLINDVISTNIKSLQGRYADGGGVDDKDKEYDDLLEKYQEIQAEIYYEKHRPINEQSELYRLQEESNDLYQVLNTKYKEKFNSKFADGGEIEKLNLTELETKILRYFLSELDVSDLGYSDVSVDDIANGINVNINSVKGSVGSLAKKGIIFVSDLGKGIGTIVYLQDDYQYLHPEYKDYISKHYADGGGVDEIKIGTKIKSSSNNYVVTKKSTFGWVMEAKNGDKLVKNEYELKQLIEKGQLQLVDDKMSDGGGVGEVSVKRGDYVKLKGKASNEKNYLQGYTGNAWVLEGVPNEYGMIEVRIESELGYPPIRYKTFAKVGDIEKVILSFANGGGIPHEDEMFHLPLEMVVYVPSTKDVDKVISVDEMDKRVNEVKEYVASRFGGYSSADKLGGFVDSNGKLVNEDVVQVVSFSTKEAFESNKEELVNQLSKWGKEWGQEAIGFEFEGDLYYVPQEGDLIKKTKKDK